MKLVSGTIRLALSLALAAVGVACAGPGRSAERSGEDVSELAATLVESARQRVELGQMRVVVRSITKLETTQTNARAQAQAAMREDPIGNMLEHELTIALSGRLNVVESELVPRPTTAVSASTLADLASTYGATHLLVGTYQPSGEGVIVSVRLIDAESHVIVAAARRLVVLATSKEKADDGPWVQRNWANAPEQEAPELAEALDPSSDVAAAPAAATKSVQTVAPPPPMMSTTTAADVPATTQAFATQLAASRASPPPPPSTPAKHRAERIEPSQPPPATAPAPAPSAASDAPRGPASYWLEALRRRRDEAPRQQGPS